MEPITNCPDLLGSTEMKTRIVNLTIKRSFERDSRPTMLRYALTTLR